MSNAIDRRTAISGLITARPFNMADNLFRLTSRAAAASVSVRFKGVKQTSRGTGRPSLVTISSSPICSTWRTCSSMRDLSALGRRDGMRHRAGKIDEPKIRRETLDDPTRARAKLKRLIFVSLAVHLAIIVSLLALFSRYRVPWPSRAGVVLPAIPLLFVVVLLLVRRAAQRKAAASK